MYQKRNTDIMMRVLTRRVRPKLRSIALEKFDSAKDKLLWGVREHPISKDINSHGTSTLLAGSKTGTLYGFMGFDSNEQSDPVGDLVEFLDQNIEFIEKRKRVNSLFSCSVVYPAKSAFNIKEFELPWTSGLGWPTMIELGISGLQNYINVNSGNSLSGEGIQSKNIVRPGAQFPSGLQYLTPLFEKFRKDLLIS